MGNDHDDAGTRDEQPLPEDVVDQAEQLTRWAREAVDDKEIAAYREEREKLLAEHEYRARIREEENDVLVLYPDEWLEDGVVQLSVVENLDRGIERPLEGPGDGDQWDTIENHNREIAERVKAEHGEVHGANAHALADFASNHYAKRIEQVTGNELQEFAKEYFPRNAWPSDDQQAVLDASLEYVFECVNTEPPTWRSESA
ncbi:rnhA operon protein [Halovenus rubra]|uniref:RnhA operon protein n=2 Tax=Halovenus rubra TaxID=869890 RepID=A0ACC7DZS5_9EURY|nr:rnhA operon protein [Halovenus rubra]